jgi:hypothetical protein
LDLYELSLDHAQTLHGQRVEVFVEVGCPVDVGDGFTDVATYDRTARVERHVYLKGNRHGIESGDKLTVAGTLLVIHHDEAVVNGVRVLALVVSVVAVEALAALPWRQRVSLDGLRGLLPLRSGSLCYTFTPAIPNPIVAANGGDRAVPGCRFSTAGC